MPWLILLASAVFEAVWATALGMSGGFTQLVPSVVFLVALTISMIGIGWAVKYIPIGTGYAVWVGVGAALTVIYAMATGAETVEPMKIVFICGIVGSVLGLKLTSRSDDAPSRADAADSVRISQGEQ